MSIMRGMTHPGDGFDNICPRNWAEPVLVLDGRRSIVAWWPPTAVCEACSAPAGPSSGGYVGPAVGNEVRYPAPETRFLCRSCARARVGLADDELTGHICSWCKSDTLHVDRGYHPRGELEALSGPERVAHVMAKYDYADRGWTVVAVEPDLSLPPATGSPWAVRFRATRELP